MAYIDNTELSQMILEVWHIYLLQILWTVWWLILVSSKTQYTRYRNACDSTVSLRYYPTHLSLPDELQFLTQHFKNNLSTYIKIIWHREVLWWTFNILIKMWCISASGSTKKSSLKSRLTKSTDIGKRHFICLLRSKDNFVISLVKNILLSFSPHARIRTKRETPVWFLCFNYWYPANNVNKERWTKLSFQLFLSWHHCSLLFFL